MRYQGKIITWNDDKGFGFVKPENSNKEVFIHIKEFNWRPQVGQKISFSLGADKHGRPCGKIAILSGEFLSHERTSLGGALSPILGLLALIAIIFFLFLTKSSYLFIAGYIGMSFLTFLAYWLDKNAAQNGNWRTPESTLHILSLLGGWPGALMAQQKFRHKTKKQPFKTIFWVTVVLNSIVLYLISNTNYF